MKQCPKITELPGSERKILLEILDVLSGPSSGPFVPSMINLVVWEFVSIYLLACICPWCGGRVVYGADTSSLATYGVIHISLGHIPAQVRILGISCYLWVACVNFIQVLKRSEKSGEKFNIIYLSCIS